MDSRKLFYYEQKAIISRMFQPNTLYKNTIKMQNNCPGFAQNWDDVCSSDFGGLCCAPGMENRRYMVEEYPESWMAHEGYCKDQGGALVAFETRAEMDCLIQYVEDKFPVDRYPYNWAIGLASSFRYKGENCRQT